MARRNVLEVQILGDDKTAAAFNSASRQAAVFGAAITGALGVAAKQAGDFEKGMAEIQTLLGAGATPAVADMRKEILGLSRSSGEALGSLTKARYDIISAGFSGAADSAEVLEGSIRLAQGGLVDVATSADLVTTAINGLGLDASQTTRITDVLFQTVKLGKTTMTELAESLGPVFSTAKVAKVSLEEVGAAMAQITAAGIDTREASTALNNLLRALAAPSKEAGRELRALGITLDNGLGPALAALAQASDDGLESLAKLVPNIRGLKAAAAASDIDKFVDNLTAMENAMGASAEAAAIMRNTTAFAFKQLRAEIVALGVEAGTELLPVLEKLVDALRGGLGLFRDMNPAVRKTAVAFTALVGTTALLGGATGTLVFQVRQLTAAYGALKAAQVGVAFTSMLNPIGLLVAAVGGAAFVLHDFWSDNKARSEETIRTIQRLNTMLPTANRKPSLSIRGFQAGGGDDGVEAVRSRADALKAAFDEVARVTSSSEFQFSDIIGTAPNDFEVLITALRKTGASTEDVQAAFGAWRAEVDAAVGKAPELASEIAEFDGTVEQATDSLGAFTDALGLPRAPEVLGELRVAFQELAQDFQFLAQDAIAGSAQAFGDAIGATIIDGKDFGAAFSEGFKDLKRSIISATAELIVMRAVMAGLRGLAGLGGPLGAIGGFLLGKNDGGTIPLKANSGFMSVPGLPGLDTFPVMMSGGESVLTAQQAGHMRRALSLPSRGESLLEGFRRKGGGGSVVVGLASGLLRTEAAEIDDRLVRVQKRRGGRA